MHTNLVAFLRDACLIARSEASRAAYPQDAAGVLWLRCKNNTKSTQSVLRFLCGFFLKCVPLKLVTGNEDKSDLMHTICGSDKIKCIQLTLVSQSLRSPVSLSLNINVLKFRSNWKTTSRSLVQSCASSPLRKAASRKVSCSLPSVEEIEGLFVYDDTRIAHCAA